MTLCGTWPAHGTDVAGTIDRVFYSSYGRVEPAQEPLGRVIGVWFVNLETQAFSVDSAHVAISLTCIHFCRSGMTRVLLAADGGIIQSSDTNTTSLSAVAVPVPADIQWGVYEVQALDDHLVAHDPRGGSERLPAMSGVVSIPTADTSTEIDDHLRAIRREYVGRTVQGFGSLTLDCDDRHAAAEQAARDAAVEKLRKRMVTGHPGNIFDIPHGPYTDVEVGNEPSLVVSAIDRPIGPTRAWKIGGPVASRFSGDDLFTAIAPLRVSFKSKAFSAGPCENPRLWVADDWEVRRVLWIHAPVKVRETTPIRIGMTKQIVAHIAGYPAAFGTVEEMNRLNFWRFPALLAPYESSARFRNGVVSHYVPPGAPR